MVAFTLFFISSIFRIIFPNASFESVCLRVERSTQCIFFHFVDYLCLISIHWFMCKINEYITILIHLSEYIDSSLEMTINAIMWMIVMGERRRTKVNAHSFSVALYYFRIYWPSVILMTLSNTLLVVANARAQTQKATKL